MALSRHQGLRFNQWVEQAIRLHGDDCPAIETGFAVIVMNLDRFRLINDALGHEAGDEALAEVAARLIDASAGIGRLARLGGDEFALLIDQGDAHTAMQAAERVLDSLRAPVKAAGQPVDVATSLGIARFPQDGQDAGALLRHADMAMFAAKRSHAGVAAFDPSHDVARQEHLTLLGELRRAIDDGQLRAHYQPKIDLVKGCTSGVEVLVR